MFTIETIPHDKLKELSVEQLEQYSYKLMAAKESLRLECKILQAEYDRRAALARFNTLSEPEKAALLQIVKAHGIASEEKVNDSDE